MARFALALAFFALGLQSAVFGQEVEKQPKIVLLFDVSESMSTIDGPARPGRDPATLPSRQEQVVRFLAGNQPILEQLLAKAPVTAYRFGATLDDIGVVHFTPGKTWKADEWARWLKGDGAARLGTNVAGSALQMLHKERDSYLQAIILFSDGRSTRAAKEEIAAFLDWVNDPKRPVPVFTVGVGGFETLPCIRVGQPLAPEESRPADRLAVRVPIRGVGLDGEEFQVLVEAQRITDAAGQPVVRERRFLPGPRVGTFTGKDQFIDFDIDLGRLKKDGLDGTWQFTAHVPSHPREAFAGSEHVSEPVSVVVQEKRMRVLVFASGTTREYQFLRTLLMREAQEKRVEMSIHLQTGFDANIDPDRLLKDFPTKIGPNAKGERFMSLSDYDAVVAIDPEWTKLTLGQRANLHKWVSDHGGGIIFVAGPVHSYQLARPGGQDFSKIQPLYPVVLKDHRLQGLAPVGGPDPTRHYPLLFTPDAKKFPFLKLDPMGDGPTAGWNGFFWNDEAFKPEAGKDVRAKRGFFTYYPVERLKPDSQVVAAFAGPKESRIGDKSDKFKDQQPFIVTMAVGAGKTFYLSTGELWRLRAYQESYYDRMWLGMIRHIARPAAIPKPVGRILMDRAATVGAIPIDGLLYKDAAKALIEVSKQPPDGKPMKQELPVDAAGKFAGVLNLNEAGDYVVRLSIPGADDFVSQRIAVRNADTDADDTRVDFAALYQLASKAEPVLRKLPTATRQEIERLLAESARFPGAPDSQDQPWLFFRLSAAGAIPLCLEKLPPLKVNANPPKAPAGVEDSEFKKVFEKPRPPVKVLIIDGAPERGRRESGDSFCIEQAIAAIPKAPFKAVFGDDLARANPVAALERDDLGSYGAIFLLNVKELSDQQLARLEKFTRDGGGVAFFLGDRVNLTHYNKSLYKDGKGLFPAPLEQIYPPLADKGLDRDVSQLLLRSDLFPERASYPIFDELFDDPLQAEPLKMLPIDRYVKVRRDALQPGRAYELATLANSAPAAALGEAVAAVFRAPSFKRIHDDAGLQKYRPAIERHRLILENLARPDAQKKAADLVDAIDDLLLERGKPDLKTFWQSADADVRALLESLVKLRRQARYGDPFIVGAEFGKGRVVAVLSTAGKDWNDFAGGSLASMIYPPFIWEALNHLTQQPLRAPPRAIRPPDKGRPPIFENVGLAYEPQKLALKDAPKELADAYLVTPDAAVPVRGHILDGAGVKSAHWIVQVHPVAVANGKFGAVGAAGPEQRMPIRSLVAEQDRRAHEQLLREFGNGAKDRTFPTGLSGIHVLGAEPFDFRQHLGRLKAKDPQVQENYLVKVWIEAASADAKAGTSRTQKPIVLLVVSRTELIVHGNRQLETVGEQMQAALERIHKAKKSLADAKLPPPAEEIAACAKRLADLRAQLKASAYLATEAALFCDRLRDEWSINRVPPDDLAALDRLCGSLRAVIEPPAASYERADRAVADLAASLSAGHVEAILKNARAAADRLQDLDKATSLSVTLMQERLVEARLMELLLQIEKKQRDQKR